MAAGQGSIEYIGKIQLDASELMRVLGMGGGGGGGGGMASGSGGATGAGDLKQQENIKKGVVKAHKDPSFMSIFKPLVALEGLKALVVNSRVANAYLGGMGKMFSAAIDLLLLPFTPLFNLLMVAMSKLLGWLIDSGVLEWMAEGVDKLVDLFGGFVSWIKLVFTDPGEAFMEAVRWLADRIKEFFENPKDWIKNAAQLAVAGAGVVAGGMIGGQMLAGMMGLGSFGPMALAGKGIGKLFGKGGGGGGGGGMPGGMGMRLGGAALGLGGFALAQTAGQQGGAMGVAGRVGGLGMMGAGIGTMFAPGIGTAIGGGLGLGLGAAQELGVPGAGAIAGMFGAGKPKGGGGGGDTNVTGDIKNIGTQNINMNIYVQDKEMAKEIIKNVDEQATASAEAG